MCLRAEVRRRRRVTRNVITAITTTPAARAPMLPLSTDREGAIVNRTRGDGVPRYCPLFRGAKSRVRECIVEIPRRCAWNLRALHGFEKSDRSLDADILDAGRQRVRGEIRRPRCFVHVVGNAPEALSYHLLRDCRLFANRNG